MIFYIAIYENDKAHVIEAMENDEAYDKAIDISFEENNELMRLYSLNFKTKKLMLIQQ